MKEHIRHIQIVFDRLRQHQLKLKLSKCKFFRERNTVLELILADSDKVHVIRNMVPP